MNALRAIGGSGSLAEIYNSIEQIRQDKPPTWQAIVRREIEHNSSDSKSFLGKHDLFVSINGIGGGVWGLREKFPELLFPFDFENPPEIISAKIYRRIRDTTMTRKLKLLHENRCQICSVKIELQSGEFYSEAHHIVPLGNGHNGLDVMENILILCPNHHVQCDYGAIKIEKASLNKAIGHIVSSEFINYHNENIYNQNGPSKSR